MGISPLTARVCSELHSIVVFNLFIIFILKSCCLLSAKRKASWTDGRGEKGSGEWSLCAFFDCTERTARFRRHWRVKLASASSSRGGSSSHLYALTDPTEIGSGRKGRKKEDKESWGSVLRGDGPPHRARGAFACASLCITITTYLPSRKLEYQPKDVKIGQRAPVRLPKAHGWCRRSVT